MEQTTQEIIKLKRQIDDLTSDYVDARAFIEDLVGNNNELYNVLVKCRQYLDINLNDEFLAKSSILNDINKYIILLTPKHETTSVSNKGIEKMTYPEFVNKHYTS
jgi:hypothetical protein